MTWATDKQVFNARKEVLDRFDTNAIRNLGQTINNHIKRYVNTAGISQNPNTNQNYIEANRNFELLVSKQKEYIQLNQDVSNKITEIAGTGDINSTLQALGNNRMDIIKLEKELKTLKQDIETSRERELSLETPRKNVSWYQGFGAKIGFTKSLHEISVPILIGFGILLLFLSGLLLKDFFTGTENTQIIESEGLFSLFTDSRFYSVLGGITLVSIVLGILAYTGRLGKRI